MATIIAVHGTFASGPESGTKWWQKGSGFERELARFVQASDGPLSIERLVWDGLNSETSRRVAGAALAQRLDTLERAGERYSLIGHSHGGSVILAALQQAATRRAPLEGLARWITVGTPFVSFTRRPLLFSRLGILGKASYMSLLTFLGLMAVAGWLDNVNKDFGLAVILVTMCTMVWFLAHLVLGWQADRRLAATGALLLEKSDASLWLPRLGLLTRLLYAMVLSLASMFVAALWLGKKVVDTNDERLFGTGTVLAILVAFHFALAWLSRLWRSRLARRPSGPATLLAGSMQRWLPLRHPQDEAVEGLSRLHRVSFPIFGRDFAVTPLTFASVMAFPIILTLVAVSPAVMTWLASAATSGYTKSTLFGSSVIRGTRLVGDGAEIAANIKFLLSAPIVLLFGGGSADLQAILMVTLGPVIYFLGSLALVATARLFATVVSRGLSRALDSAAWRQIRASALGSDTLGETSRFASAEPGIATAVRAPLPTALANEISAVSDLAAGRAVAKLRSSINQLAFAEDKRVRSDLVSEYLTWEELIHTAYFSVPRFNKLVAFAITQSPGFAPTPEFVADPDYALIAVWHAEMSAKAPSPVAPVAT